MIEMGFFNNRNHNQNIKLLQNGKLKGGGEKKSTIP